MISKVQQIWLKGSSFLRPLWKKHIKKKPALGLTISRLSFIPFVQLKNEAEKVVNAEATCLTRSKERTKAFLNNSHSNFCSPQITHRQISSSTTVSGKVLGELL